MELFAESEKGQFEPLAARMRPRTIDEFIGQEHIIGPGRLLRRAIQADQLSSIILYGPPGTGKTTLAQVIANTTRSHFTTMNAVLSGVKELRDTIAEAQERRNLYSRKTILFVDEVHRWNKSQQDALLPWVENGVVILIGATTENPFFEVNRALTSRSRIFQLKALTDDDLFNIAKQALDDKIRGYGNECISFDNAALAHIVRVSNGDARSLLNALELAVCTTELTEGSKHITMAIAEQSIQEKAVLYDKEGDCHFDVASAFIKSIRGSDPDAVLYWLAKMIQAGENPHFIFRRMLISACEDIGLANPNALVVVNAAAAAFDRIGLPEGRFHLTHAALYLANSPKSNSCMAIFDAIATVLKEKESEVPNHLRDASRDSAAFGHGEGYLYPHAYRDHWVAQQYLPSGLQGKIFYNPSNTGYEATIKEEVERRREIQLATARIDDADEVLTFSPPDAASAGWLARLNVVRTRMLAGIREKVTTQLDWKRHYRVLDLNAGSGLFVWEAVRRVPEGGVWGLVEKTTELEMLNHYSKKLTALEQPVFLPAALPAFLADKEAFVDKQLLFDIVIGRNVFTRVPDRDMLIAGIHALLDSKGQAAFAEIIPARSTRLSQLLTSDDLVNPLQAAEALLYADPAHCLLNWDAADLLTPFAYVGFQLLHHEIAAYEEEKQISQQELTRWSEAYRPFLSMQLNPEASTALWQQVAALLVKQTVRWKREVLVFRVRKE